MMGGMGLMMVLLWVVFLSLIVAGVVVLVRVFGGRGGPARPGFTTSALELLEERYARGAIDRDEFEQRRCDLRS